MEMLQNDVSQEARYDEILCGMDLLWWVDLEDDEHEALDAIIRETVQTHVLHPVRTCP